MSLNKTNPAPCGKFWNNPWTKKFVLLQLSNTQNIKCLSVKILTFVS